jgi:hypothetical protein
MAMTSTHAKRKAPASIERTSRALEDPAGFLLDSARALLVILFVVGVLVSMGRGVWRYAIQGELTAGFVLDGGLLLLAGLYVAWSVVRESRNG